MNLQLLIDSIVRQTTLLLAQLATARGLRAPLAHVANQVFLDLAEELSRQGVSRKVSADMFGMALRTYLRKIQRLGEGSTERERSLWQAVLAHLADGGVMTRGELLAHFHGDGVELVIGVLRDLSESGLVFRTGTGPATSYRSATSAELKQISVEAGDGLDELLWAVVYREGPLSEAELEKLGRGAAIGAALERLVAAGRIQRHETAGSTEYTAEQLYIPKHAPAGWEAAIFDHYQAMVKAIAARLTLAPDSKQADRIGGSTYSFDVWPGHPFEEEALAQLERFRDRTSRLRSQIREYNQAHRRPARYTSVTVYGGQFTVETHGDDENDI